jgi:uncharacterized membrane protein YfcA
MEISTLVIVALSVALAFFMQRITGFGSAIIAFPLIATVWLPHDAINLMLLFQTFFGLLLFPKVWRSLTDPKLRLFLLAAIPMSIGGMWLLPFLPARAVKLSVALVIIVVLIQRTFKPHFLFPHKFRGALALCFGFVSGIVQGAFGMGGPLFLAYYGSVEKRPESLRGASIALFAIVNLIRLPVSLATAQLNETVLWGAAAAVVPFGLAVFLGAKFASKISENWFNIVLTTLLALAAINILFG